MTYRYPGGLVRRTAANTSITGASGVWDLGSQAQAVKTNTWPISGLANPVSGSLRFRASASAYLNRTQGTSTNQYIGTWSFWCKRGTLGTTQRLFEGYTASSDTGVMEFEFINDNLYVGGWTTNWRVTTQVFRDSSAWYHFVVTVDTTQSTANNRIRVYVNGTEITAFSTTNNPSQNSTFGLNNNSAVLQIGRRRNVSSNDQFFDGYLAEVYFVDGQALTPSSFGQTSPITGVWEPIKYTGTYGTNGFYLSLSDTSSIGKDFSGNGNNWSPNNISTTSGATFDLMRDVPTQWAPQGVTDVGGVVRGNYATLNPLSASGGTLSGGNLNYSMGNTKVAATMMGMTSGKYYSEVTINSTSNGFFIIGLCKVNTALSLFSLGVGYYADDGTKYVDGTNSSYGASYTAGNVIGIAADFDSNQVTFYKNNISQGTINLPSSTDGYVLLLQAASGSTSATFTANFGQRPFTYTPPTGFKSLCTTNLPTPTIGATTATAANKYFDATLYTGTGATLSVTNAGTFQPDFVWLKSRSAATNHQAFDAVRGATKVSVINAAEAESTSANTITSFNSNGFTVGTNTAINTSSATYVAWQWWAGGSTVTNTTGSISAQVRASTTTGFSIATYTGNGTGGATIGHGLGAAPSMLIFRNRDAADNSALVWHTGFNTNQGQMLLSSSAAIYNPGNGLYFNSTTPGASVVTLGTSGGTNGSGSNMIMYAWTPIAGYSAFGSYTGNGSADGTFVFTGFRPRFLIVKRTNDIGSWIMTDSARSTYNVTGELFNANTNGAEFTTGDIKFDYLSNGFKLREVNGAINASGSTYIYMAFAENPFKNSLAR